MLALDEELSTCLKACGGGDFTHRLGCLQEEPAPICESIYAVADNEPSSSDAFFDALFDAMVSTATTALDNASRDRSESSHTNQDEEAPQEHSYRGNVVDDASGPEQTVAKPVSRKAAKPELKSEGKPEKPKRNPAKPESR